MGLCICTNRVLEIERLTVNSGINKDIFKDHSQYVRDALVAATFEDIEIDVYKNKTYLLKVIEDALNTY